MIEVALQVLTLTEDAALLTSNGIISAAEIMEKIDNHVKDIQPLNFSNMKDIQNLTCSCWIGMQCSCPM